MDLDAFDKIITDNDEKEYVFAQGYDNFINKLLADFPNEEKALRLYCDKIKEVCHRLHLPMHFRYCFHYRQHGSTSQ